MILPSKRSLVAGLLALPLFSIVASAAKRVVQQIDLKDAVRLKVPDDVTKVRVRAWSENGNQVLDTMLNVKPNQVFQLDVIKPEQD
jgi:hypothetical protein